jgi:hypothetical protein
MPAMFIEVPPGIRMDAKERMMEKTNAAREVKRFDPSARRCRLTGEFDIQEDRSAA